jgi:Sec-independent protein translocase protein TatA
MFLDPAKVLFIAVVALMVLGPDQLPKVAKSAAALLNEIRRFRARLDAQVKESFPDLPAPEEILEAVRSPRTLLDMVAVGESPADAADTEGVGDTVPHRPDRSGGPTP